MRMALVALGVLVAAAAATLMRYGSLDPCVWLETDLIEDSILPPVAVRARIRGAFFVDGVTDPGPLDCLVKWWDWRGEELPDTS